LTGDNDTQLQASTKRMREETKGSIGWLRLGKLMVKLVEYNKAEDLYKLLLSQTTDERERKEIFFIRLDVSGTINETMEVQSNFCKTRY